MAEKRLSWVDWQKKANAEYIKGQYGAAQMIRDWGYPQEFGPNEYKIEFDKGNVKRKDRSARQQHRGKADELRTKRDVTTTEAAELERKALKAEISKEAQSTLVQYGTGGAKPVFEHNVQLSDPYWQTTSQSPGDPTNLSKSDPFFEAQKTEFEKYNTQAGRPFVPTVNEITGELRVIPRQYFDSVAAPSTLPGLDIALDAEPKKAYTKAVKALPGPGITTKPTASVRFTPGVTPAVKPVAKPITKPVAKPAPVVKPKPVAKPKALTNKAASIRFSRSLIPTEVPSQERFGPGGIMSTIDMPHERQGIWQR